MLVHQPCKPVLVPLSPFALIITAWPWTKASMAEAAARALVNEGILVKVTGVYRIRKEMEKKRNKRKKIEIQFNEGRKKEGKKKKGFTSQQE
jgi:hypothetical protein